jgi:hypothetical protein
MVLLPHPSHLAARRQAPTIHYPAHPAHQLAALRRTLIEETAKYDSQDSQFGKIPPRSAFFVTV